MNKKDMIISFFFATISITLLVLGDIVGEEPIPLNLEHGLLILGFTLIGIFAGWVMFSPSSKHKEIIK